MDGRRWKLALTLLLGLGACRDDQAGPKRRAVNSPIPKEKAIPVYHVKRVSQPPVIDGSLMEAAWAQAQTVELVGSLDGEKPKLKTTAKLSYDDHHLYVAFDCEDPDIWGTFLRRDEPLYTEEVVEIFVDADADGKTYDEIEISPNNTVFDASFTAPRQGMNLAYDSGVRSAVKLDGTLNHPSDRDRGWSVEMAIPISRLSNVLRIPPKPGDKWRFNLYRLEHLQRKQIEGQAFSPLFVGDFHYLPRFAWLIFD